MDDIEKQIMKILLYVLLAFGVFCFFSCKRIKGAVDFFDERMDSKRNSLS